MNNSEKFCSSCGAHEKTVADTSSKQPRDAKNQIRYEREKEEVNAKLKRYDEYAKGMFWGKIAVGVISAYYTLFIFRQSVIGGIIMLAFVLLFECGLHAIHKAIKRRRKTMEEKFDAELVKKYFDTK